MRVKIISKSLRRNMKNLLLAFLLTLPLLSYADVNYINLSSLSGDIEVDSESFDVSAINIGYLSTSGNIVFSTSISNGEVEIYNYELDFVTQGISIGYAVSDLTTGSIVLGIDYGQVEIQNPGSSNVKDSSTDGYIGYAKLSGEGVDYSFTLSDGTISGKLFIPLGDSELRGVLGFSSNDEGDSMSFGAVYQF